MPDASDLDPWSRLILSATEHQSRQPVKGRPNRWKPPPGHVAERRGSDEQLKRLADITSLVDIPQSLIRVTDLTVLNKIRLLDVTARLLLARTRQSNSRFGPTIVAATVNHELRSVLHAIDRACANLDHLEKSVLFQDGNQDGSETDHHMERSRLPHP